MLPFPLGPMATEAMRPLFLARARAAPGIGVVGGVTSLAGEPGLWGLLGDPWLHH